MHRLQRVAVDGCAFLIRAGTCDEVVVLNEDYYAERNAALTYVPRPGDQVVDAGAHIGSFAIPLARRWPELRVVALEPAVANFELLERNVALNRLGNVLTLPLALANQTGTATLHAGPDSWAHTTDPDTLHVDRGNAAKVRAVDLDRLIDECGIERIALVKLNIEGAEYDVLLHAAAETLERVERLWVEFHPHRRYRGSLLAARLAAAGFDVELRVAREPGKGWIEAIRGSRLRFRSKQVAQGDSRKRRMISTNQLCLWQN